MKRIYSRFRIMLLAFGLGLAAVYMQQGLPFAWWGVPVDLPDARSGSVLEVTVPLEEKLRGPSYLCDEFTDKSDRAACLNRFIFENRDMSIYDDGDRQGCGLESSLLETHVNCKQSMEKARRFVWEHWKKRKRGYVAVVSTFPEGEYTDHLFIEPDETGSWRVAVRTVPQAMLVDPVEPRFGDVVEIEWYRATADDARVTPGALYLKLSNITGDAFIL